MVVRAGSGIALGGLIIVQRGWVAGKGQNGARLGQRKEVTAGSWEQAGRGPGLASLEALPLPGEWGCSWLPPQAINLGRRVTWMPGIPEPGLFRRCARLLPPSALLPVPRPHAREEGPWDKRDSAGGASLPPWKASCSPPLLPSPWPRSVSSNLLPPQPGGGGTLPPVLSWWLGMAKVSSPSSTRAFKVLVAQSPFTICIP